MTSRVSPASIGKILCAQNECGLVRPGHLFPKTQAEGRQHGEVPRKFRLGQTVEFFIRLQTTKNKETMAKAK